jgi:hypothetical protein
MFLKIFLKKFKKNTHHLVSIFLIITLKHKLYFFKNNAFIVLLICEIFVTSMNEAPLPYMLVNAD